MIVGDCSSVGQLGVCSGSINPGDAGSQADVDMMVGVERGGPQGDLVAKALQEGFGHGRSLIGELLLVAEQRNAATKARLPQRPGGLDTGVTSPGNDDRWPGHQP